MAVERREIRLPDLGMDSQEIVFAAWLVEVGANVEEGEDLFEVETDKASVVFEAEDSGILSETLIESGTVKAGDILGYLNA